MNFKNAIIIPVFVYTDQEFELSKLGLNEGEEMGFSHTEERAFWEIQSAHPYTDNEDITTFICAGESYVSPIQFLEFVKKVNNHN